MGYCEGMNATENQTRLRRAKEALAACKAAEDDARRALADAVESSKRAKERYEVLFMAEESAEVARRRANYLHETK